MNTFVKKTLIILVSVVLLLLVAGGSTLAYLFAKTDSLENTLSPAQVSCAVVENGEEYTDSTVNVSSKSNVTIKNTSNISAYIRASILVTWKSADGNVYAAKPEPGTDKDYILQINTSDWSEHDGFYYYKSDVPAGATTSALITSASQINQGPMGTDNTQYYLSIEIVAEAIQAEGMGANSAQNAWTAARNG